MQPSPPRIQLIEVAPRDGLQVEQRTLPTETKLALLERLADAGHTVIETTSFVSPKAVPQLADAEELLRRLKRRPGVRYPVLVPNERGLDRALGVGVDDIAIFASASDSYSRKNLNRPRDEAIAAYAGVVRAAKDAHLRVRGYLSMVRRRRRPSSTAARGSSRWAATSSPSVTRTVSARRIRSPCCSTPSSPRGSRSPRSRCTFTTRMDRASRTRRSR
jgi:isopropylmalate/homocitrate/citramalate synthase